MIKDGHAIGQTKDRYPIHAHKHPTAEPSTRQSHLPTGAGGGCCHPNNPAATLRTLYTRTPRLRFVLLTTTNTTTPPTTARIGSLWPSMRPTETMRAASYECHDELPRWLKMGVWTWPLRLWRRKLSGGPARTLRVVRLGW